MAENTGIEWADDSYNNWVGCQRISPACANCYAASMAKRFTPGAGAWDGTIVRTENLGSEQHLGRLERCNQPRRIFVGSMTDLALVGQEDPSGLAALLSRIYRIQHARAHHKPEPRTPHTWIILTKRPLMLKRFLDKLTWEADTMTFRVRMRATEAPLAPGMTIPGLMLGVTAENQEQAYKRIPDLLTLPLADGYLVSAEPLLGALSLKWWLGPGRVAWVITGGETGGRGVKTRPMHPEWVEALQAEALAAGVPFFFKSWGDWTPQSLDNGRRDGTLGAWTGPEGYQFMPAIAAPPPEGYPLMAKLPKTERPPQTERPKMVPPFPAPGCM